MYGQSLSPVSESEDIAPALEKTFGELQRQFERHISHRQAEAGRFISLAQECRRDRLRRRRGAYAYDQSQSVIERFITSEVGMTLKQLYLVVST